MKLSKLITCTILIYCNSLFSQQNKTITTITREAFDSVPSLGSVLVWQNNKMICEKYYNKANSKTEFSIKSVTKSIVSALAGIAYDRGLLPDLNTPILKVMPEYIADTLIDKKITLKNLLTMQTGILWDDNNPPTKKNVEYLRCFMDTPYESEPGTKFRYCTPGSHLLSVAVARCVKTDLRSFADSNLFKPLGITISDWPADNLGRTFGGAGLVMKASDMLTFGLLYLNEGQVNGKQLISKYWINESTKEQCILNEWDVLPGANGYGYFWWRRKTNGYQAFVASGYGGQLICIIPVLKTVIVTTCFVNEKNRGRSEIKRLHYFIDKIVNVIK